LNYSVCFVSSASNPPMDLDPFWICRNCFFLRFIKYICSQTVSCPSCGGKDFHFTKPLNTFVTRDELAMVRLKKIILGFNEKRDDFDTILF